MTRAAEIRQAERRGRPEMVWSDPEMEIRALVGTFGTLYELEIMAPAISPAMAQILKARLPGGLVFHDTGADDGPNIAHFWKRVSHDENPA